MKVTKWVDFGTEVDVEIGADDVANAFSEALGRATQDRLGEEPSKFDILRAFNTLGTFCKALTDEHIGVLNEHQRKLIADFMTKAAERIAPKTVTAL